MFDFFILIRCERMPETLLISAHIWSMVYSFTQIKVKIAD
jgi:hypothetical protein